MEVKWIKLSVNIFSDEKILLIESLPDAYAILLVWFKLLCLAGRQNNSGVFTLNDRPYTGKMLATVFRMPEETVSSALATFEEYGMIETIDGVITIPGWAEYQNVESLESRREYMRGYMEEYRGRQKALAKEKSGCKHDVNFTDVYDVNFTTANVNTIEREEKKKENKNISPKKEKRKVPTLEEVTAYVVSRGNKIDAKRFYEYFDAGGWKDASGNEVKNWKQKVITWESHEKQGSRKGMQADTSSIDFNEYDARLMKTPQYRRGKA